MKNLAFLAVCNYFGGQKQTAKVLSCTPGFVGHVVHGRRPMPLIWAPIIERASGGRFSCEELAPDFPWDVLRNSSSVKKPHESVQKDRGPVCVTTE